MPIKSILLNNNIPISNSFILNNYSIQNLIISPTNVAPQLKKSINTNLNLINNYKSSYSPSPHKSVIKNISVQNEYGHLLRNGTPTISHKRAGKFNSRNHLNSPIDVYSSQNLKHIPKIEIIAKTEEKHPKDSKRIYLKINQSNDNNAQKLKNSISQRLFKTIKKPFKQPENNTKANQLKKNKETTPIKKSTTKKYELNYSKTIQLEPTGNIVLEEYQFAEAIGKGTFGKIFCVRWIKNNKLYALKKEILTDKETIEKRKDAFKIIQNFTENTKSKGVVHIYGNLLLKNTMDFEYHYYELMEKAERDWDQEINIRSQYRLYYKENEIIDIMKQLILTLALLQKNHITHRDIKPQNILVINGSYKLCDFGEIRVLKRNGLIVQRVRGSELYMSPILFYGLHLNLIQVRHNTYKSDVFSLGMCLFFASSLTYTGVDSIRELTNMNKIKEILFEHLGKRYSAKYIMFILQMLEVNEEKRPDFIQLEMKLKKTFS